MSELLLLPVMLLPVPLLALVVLARRARAVVRRGGAAALASRTAAAVRHGVARPVWPGLIALAVAAAALTAGLERAYLAAAPTGADLSFDLVLVILVLGLVAAGACAMPAGLAAAVVSRARGFGAGTAAGVLTLAAVAAGTAAAHLPLRAAYLADPGAFPTVGDLGAGDLLMPFDIFLVTLVWALPWPVLGAALAGRARIHDRLVRDMWQLLLDVATTDLPEARRDWGTALRAELAAIDEPAQRRAFAIGGAWAALRAGALHGARPVAAGVGVVVAAGSLAASRWSLAHDQGGILSFWVSFPSVLLLAVALVVARRSGSFVAGLHASWLSGAAALVAVVVVGVPEAILWAQRRAGYLSTGDAIPPTWQAAVLDVLRPEFLIGMAAFWTMAALGGAAIGVALPERRSRPS
jgi:hypothetical protein